MAISTSFQFRDNIRIGQMSAEDDEAFLSECFIDNAAYSDVRDLKSPKCILLGRTGSGKSAVILRIQELNQNVIEIEPQSLALNYISNSDILGLFSKIGVKLDIFYQMLWRHVLAVEILKHYFQLRNQNDFYKFKDWVTMNLGLDKRKEAGLEYLERWDAKFWAETEERIKEITSKLEGELSSNLGIDDVASLKSRLASSEEIKREYLHKAQKIVDNIQIRDLGAVIRIIAEDILKDKTSPYFILIDRLDEDWVDDIYRYKLIRALIEAVKSFRKITTLKIVVAIRTDLLERVYRHTRDAGFQEEKYEDLNAPVRWSDIELKDFVDKRIALAIKRQYSKGNVGFSDIFPAKIGGKPSFDYMVQRTLRRPRDVIDFVNHILIAADGKTTITEKIVRNGETEYSRKRLRALCFEWQADHPCLEIYLKLLEKKRSRFPLGELDDAALTSLVEKLIDSPSAADDVVGKIAIKLFEDSPKETLKDVRIETIKVLYKVGAIGVSATSQAAPLFSDRGPATIDSSDITEDARILVHPMLWRAVGVFKERLGGSVTDAETD